jgi:putative ABC transport system permease protein
MVKVDNKNNLKVTGIIKDVPANSSLVFKLHYPIQLF